jgi:hypothetical protein
MHCEFGERVEPPIEGSVLVVPNEAHDRERLFHPRSSLFEVRPVHVVFERPPSHAHAKRDSAARDLIDRCDLLGNPHWIVNRKLEDPSSDANRGCSGGNGSKKRQWIAQVAGHEVMVADRDGVES